MTRNWQGGFQSGDSLTDDQIAKLQGLEADVQTALAGIGGAQNLSQVLTHGNDAGASKIVNLADPTSTQDAATKHYVDTSGVGGPPSGSASGDLGGSYPGPTLKQGTYEYNVRNAPYSAAGDNSTDDASAIQSALTAQFNATSTTPRVYLPPPVSAYKFGTTLTLKSGNALIGDGTQGSGPQMNYAGADATNAIVFDGVSNSRGWIRGFRLADVRVSPTSGGGIHCTTTNGLVIEHVLVAGFPGDGIYVGNTSGTPDNYVVRHVWTNSAGGYGLTLDHCTEAIVLEDIKGDANTATSTGMLGLIRLIGNAGTGYTNVTIVGAKMEVTGTPSPAPDLVFIDSTFKGTVTLMGGHLGSGGGYIVNVQSNNCVVNVLSSATVSSTGLMHFGAGVTGNLYSKNATTAISANTTQGDGSTVRHIGAVSFVSAGLASAVL